MTAIEILEATKQRLVDKGWGKTNERCLYVTIDRVVTDPDVWNIIAPTALRAIRTVIGCESIVAWNDRQESVLPVFTAIDAAINLLRKEADATHG